MQLNLLIVPLECLKGDLLSGALQWVTVCEVLRYMDKILNETETTLRFLLHWTFTGCANVKCGRNNFRKGSTKQFRN